MKKLIKVLLITSILCTSILGFCGCENNNLHKEDNQENIKYYMIYTGYLNNVDETNRATEIISTKEELNKYIVKYDKKSWDLEGNEIDGQISKCLNKYDEQFFETKSLALYYIILTSGSQSVDLDEPEIKGDSIVVKYKVNIPEIGTCDMSGELVVIEVDKNIKKIDENIQSV